MTKRRRRVSRFDVKKIAAVIGLAVKLVNLIDLIRRSM
jgi:hypothetical protein